MLNELLQKTFFGNTALSYIIVAGAIVLGLILVKIIASVVIGGLRRWTAKTAGKLDDIIIEIMRKNAVPLLYYGVFYVATRSLVLPSALDRSINVIGVILLTLLSIRLISGLIVYIFEHYWLKDADLEKKRGFKGVIPAINVLLWGLGIIFLLDNLGFKISTVIAGLGIGGVAVALAAQAVLGDLFSYVSILMDRPFETGDFIILESGHLGSIEHIGIKSTRLRSLGGEQIIVSNSDLTSSRIRNYKRMQNRRVVFKLGVIYQTPLESLKEIPVIIEKIITDLSDTGFDRSHFSSYGDFSLDFETVYYVKSSDYNKYMDIQQAINLAIFEEFEKRSIEFAYPTQTIFMEKTGEQPTLS
ncbi:MAG: mechanosensitive ion channel family protein [Thermodesulfobacteriota bacterium]|nr:MAG: mechanosensitive ion channel family protein [Thermodesulfobacteriota bacterium]